MNDTPTIETREAFTKAPWSGVLQADSSMIAKFMDSVIMPSKFSLRTDYGEEIEYVLEEILSNGWIYRPSVDSNFTMIVIWDK